MFFLVTTVALALGAPVAPPSVVTTGGATNFVLQTGVDTGVLWVNELAIPLVRTGSMKWEGIAGESADSIQLAQVSRTYDGLGRLITRIVLEDSKVTEWQFASSSAPNRSGTASTILGTRRVCTCDPQGPGCTLQKCDLGSFCQGNSGPICTWINAVAQEGTLVESDTPDAAAD